MRVAILADIHGNQIGLEAVLADIAPKNVDEYWFLGDYCFGGAEPAKVLETISQIENASFIYGNGDRYLLDKHLPPAEELALIDDAERLEWILHSFCDLSWVIGAVARGGWLDWIAELPLEIRRTLPDGTSVLLVHARPGEHNGVSLTPDLTDEQVWEMFGHVPEDLIFIGHMHVVQERRINGKHIFNPGSIGKPVGKELRATYAILEADESGYSITPHYVEYDTVAVIEQFYQFKYPNPAFITHFYKGEFVPPWEREKNKS